MLAILKVQFMFLFAFSAVAVLLIPRVYQVADKCASSYTLCSPPGASSNSTPTIGDPILQQLYVDLVNSSLPNGEKNKSNSALSTIGEASLCCLSYLDCLAMSQLLLPFCYDRFTTNFFLPDGSYGNVISGIYVNPSGDVANLISGEYTLVNGTRGNIYADNGAARPKLATLSLPEQYTAQGVGSAVPASILGTMITETYVLVLPGTTVKPSTINGSTRSSAIIIKTELTAMTMTITSDGSIVISTLAGTTLYNTAISIVTIPTSTIYGTTFQGITTTVTATVPVIGQPTTAISAAIESLTSMTDLTNASYAATTNVSATVTSTISASSSLVNNLAAGIYVWILLSGTILILLVIFFAD